MCGKWLTNGKTCCILTLVNLVVTFFNNPKGVKMKRVLMMVVLASLAACSTTKVTKADEPIKSPTPAVVKDQTVAAQGKVENTQTIDLPAWYIKAPASTEDYVYITGTGISSDLSMSRSKALLDAQVQLADKINGMINALTRQVKKDDSGQVGTDKTTQTVKKLIVDTALTGYHLEDSKVMAENRGYRTFVLIRYPMGDANRLLKEKLQRERQDKDDEASATDELERELMNRKKPAAAAPAPAPVVDKQSAAPVVDIRPVATGPRDLEGQPVKLMDISDPKIRAIRDTAAAKPGAIVEHVTVQ
jgi:hypothetical protein